MSRKIINNQRGDTIMEVLICVAMLGFMLGSAFTLTNRNQLSARASQERSEGVRLAEKQIEYLRTYYAKHNPNVPVDLADNFCFTGEDASTDGGYSPTETTPAPNWFMDTNLADGDTGDNEGNYIGECKQSPNGYTYRTNVWKANSAAATSLGAKENTHVVTVRWDNVKGGAQEEVKVYYSVDQLSAGFYGGALASGGGPAVSTDYCPNIPGDQASSDSSYYKEGPDCYTQYSINILPNSFYECIRLETLNDGADGCFVPGGISPAMFAWRNVDVKYSIPANTIHEGQAKIQIKYRQHNNPAPRGYQYNVSIYLRSRSPLNINYPATTFQLPAGDPGVEMTSDLSIPVTSSSVTANAIGIRWDNNLGIDPNLRIDSIRVYRP